MIPNQSHHEWCKYGLENWTLPQRITSYSMTYVMNTEYILLYWQP